MRIPSCPVDLQSINVTFSTPPLISLPIVKPPRQPEVALRTTMFLLGFPKAIPACGRQREDNDTGTCVSGAERG